MLDLKANGHSPGGGASTPSPKASIPQQGPERTNLFGSVNEEVINKEIPQRNENNEIGSQGDKTGVIPGRKDKPEGAPKVSSTTCKPIATDRPRIELSGQKIEEQIQYMRDHTLIGKFIGFWPTEKALYGWIATKWKPKGDVTLQLGPKGFFTVIFFCLEDKYRILDEGPYFFNSTGLYLREWTARFNPDKEDLTWAPVWIRMYSLPDEYWDEDILKDIGNGLGEYIKAVEETKI